MRKTLTVLVLTLFAAAGVSAAQAQAEQIPADVIAALAPATVQIFQQQFPNPPVKVDPNPDKALGYHVQEQVGLVMMPDKGVNAKTAEDAGEKEVPVAVLATKGLTVMDGQKIIAGNELAVLDFNGMVKLPMFFLAVSGKGADKTLHVYSKDGKCLAKTPLKKQAGDAAAPVGLKLVNINVDQKRLDLVVSIGGSHEATLKMAWIDI